MKNYKKFVFLLLFVFSTFLFAEAQELEFVKGAEKSLANYKLDEKTRCIIYNKYVVKTFLKDNIKDDIGTGEGYEIEVFRRDVKQPLKKNCGDAAGDVSLKLKNEEGNGFGGISGDLLFVSRNEFPDGADFDVYDLKKNERVFTSEFSDWDNFGMSISNARFLNYRQWSKKDGLLKNCSQAQKWKREGFGISWLQTKRLDLQTLKETPVGNLRCINVQ